MRLHSGLLRSSDKSNSNIIEHEISKQQQCRLTNKWDIYTAAVQKSPHRRWPKVCVLDRCVNNSFTSQYFDIHKEKQTPTKSTRGQKIPTKSDRRPQPNHLSAGKGTPPQPSHWKTRKEWRLQPQHQMARKGGALPNHPRGWERAKERARCDDVC